MRHIGLDVHQGFCEVAIREHGKTRSAGRVASDRDALELFAGSLGPTDEVAMEIARIITPHRGRDACAGVGPRWGDPGAASPGRPPRGVGASAHPR
ncbi:MAG: hypothetical protein ABR992_12070 [Solirubrobacteraceae bacterium]